MTLYIDDFLFIVVNDTGEINWFQDVSYYREDGPSRIWFPYRGYLWLLNNRPFRLNGPVESPIVEGSLFSSWKETKKPSVSYYPKSVSRIVPKPVPLKKPPNEDNP